MKINLKTFKLLTLFLLILGVTACSDDDNNTEPIVLQNIVDTLIADPELTSLVAALERADLVDLLRNGDDWTVLAPTNEAFSDFLGSTPLDNIPVPVLTELLLYHVISSRIPSVAITSAGSGYEVTNASGPSDTNLSIYYEFDTDPIDGGIFFNGVSLVEVGDIFATNGVIHKVDSVIELPTIGTFAASNPALSSLVSAMIIADTGSDATIDWIETVFDEDAGPFTVFAPTDDAFANLLLELDPSGNTELSDLDPATLNAVLLMHVVNGNVTSSDLPNLMGTVPTLGGDIALNTDTLTLTDGLGREIGIIESLINIQATNGVVHAVDTVIRPTE